MNEFTDNGIYLDPDIARFYDIGGTPRPDFEFCRSLARGANSVLDLGCGTGALAVSMAQTAQVTAVDPARAMIDIARGRPGADQVEFVEADARSLALDRKFDLILLTGHTFQVFLTQRDQLAVLATIANHLAPTGQFIFDSRNPDFPASKERDPLTNRRRVLHPTMGEIEAWNGSAYDETLQILSYENGYRVLGSGKEFSAQARIRYTSQPDLAHLLQISGLAADRWMGDWQGAKFAQYGREIIPLGRLVCTP